MIAVLDYGIGNLRSAEKALQHVGADACLVQSPHEAAKAEAIVLPGVGAFGACMNALRQSGLDVVAVESIEKGLPFLGICVGLQMLYEGSNETPGVQGLGVIPGQVRRIEGNVKLPQMQWNQVDLVLDCRLFAGIEEQPWMYFVHSYAAEMGPDVVGTCSYGGDLPAVIQRDNLWAMQFHPEKSSTNGLRLLSNFVNEVKR